MPQDGTSSTVSLTRPTMCPRWRTGRQFDPAPPMAYGRGCCPRPTMHQMTPMTSEERAKMTPEERAKETAMRQARLAAEQKSKTKTLKEHLSEIGFALFLVGVIALGVAYCNYESPEENGGKESSTEYGPSLSTKSNADLLVTAINKIYAERATGMSVSRQGTTLLIFSPDMATEGRKLIAAGLSGTVCGQLVSMLDDSTPMLVSAGFSHVKLSSVDHRCSL